MTKIIPAEIYCDPECGKGCTRAEYDRIVGIAVHVAIMCGPYWTTNIFDNLGWHYEAISPCGRLRITDRSAYPYGDFSKGFTCYISAPGERGIDWSGSGATPHEAANDAFTNLMAAIGYLFRGINLQNMLPAVTDKEMLNANSE